MRIAALLLVLPAAVLAAQDLPPHGLALAIGRSYTSTRALGEPATFELFKEIGRPWLSTLDVGAMVSGAAGRSWFDAGLRASTGSSRPLARRVYGALVRANRHLDPVVVAVSGEYAADGGFDVQKGLVNLELTPTAVPALALGIPRHGLRWRPWLAAGYGNVFQAGAAAADVEQDGFFRMYLRAEVAFERAPLTASLEGTSWLVRGAVRGTSYGTGSLSLAVGAGWSVTLAGELGRQPPSFERTGRVGIGVGFRLRPD